MDTHGGHCDDEAAWQQLEVPRPGHLRLERGSGSGRLADPELVRPFGTYTEAAAALLSLLWELSGLDLLMVTRVDLDEDRQEVVAALVNGSLTVIPSVPWSGSACVNMTTGVAPAIAPCIADVPAYAAAPNLTGTGLASYAGAAIHRGDGSAYGTVCGFGYDVRDDSMWDLLPQFRTVARCLGGLLAAGDLADERIAEAHANHAVQLAHALTDPVTGLANRTGLERAIALEDSRQQRYGHTVTVVVCDVDNLKIVNDHGGHAAGDAVLARVADALRSISRASDVLARSGGDEFLLLLPGEQYDGPAVHRLRTRLADLPVSVGAADTRPAISLATAREIADRRMYEEKRRKSGANN